MKDNVYKVVQLIGTSSKSWEEAGKVAIKKAAKSLRDLRVAEVVEQDMVVKHGKVKAYRTTVRLSLKYK